MLERLLLKELETYEYRLRVEQIAHASVTLQECLEAGRVVPIVGEIRPNAENSFAVWESQLDILLKTPGPVVITIKTVGGYLDEIKYMADKVARVRSEQGREVFTLGREYCYSAGVDALLLGHPDGIFVTPGTELKLHGSIPDLEFIHEFPQEEVQRLKGILADPDTYAVALGLRRRIMEETGTIRTIRDRLFDLNSDAWPDLTADFIADRSLTPEEALEKNLIDGIVLYTDAKL